GGSVLRQKGVRAPREAEGGLSEEGRQGEHPQGGRRDRRGAARPDGRYPAQRRDDGRFPALPSGRDGVGGRGPQREGGQERARRGRKAWGAARHEGLRDAGSAAAQGTGSRGAEDLVSLRRAAEEGSVSPRAGDLSQRPPRTLPRGRCRNGPPRETSRRRGRRRAEDHCSDRTGPDPLGFNRATRPSPPASSRLPSRSIYRLCPTRYGRAAGRPVGRMAGGAKGQIPALSDLSARGEDSKTGSPGCGQPWWFGADPTRTRRLARRKADVCPAARLMTHIRGRTCRGTPCRQAAEPKIRSPGARNHL